MMPIRPTLALFAALTAALLAAPTARAADVGVTIEVSQPGVYGRIDIGRFPQPAVVLPQPVIIVPAAVVVRPQPVYLWVPPGHRKDWRKHCGKYNACGVPVYFVRHDWYDQHVRYADRRDDRYDDRRDDDRGRGAGRGKDRDDHPGKGHGKGKGRD
jgi:hypothetical protein